MNPLLPVGLCAVLAAGSLRSEMASVADAQALKEHILEVRDLPLTDMDVRTVIRVSDYGVYPNSGQNILPGIRQALSAAASAEKPVLVLFEKGSYFADTDETVNDAVIYLSGMQDVIVDGQGAEIIIGSAYLHFTDVRSSENIIVRNFEIDYDPLPFSQGTVVAVDTVNGAFEVETDEEFPNPDEDFFSAAESWGMLKDPAVPGRLKPGSVSFYRRTACVPVGENRFRITLETPSRIAHFEVGDRYAQVSRLSRLCSFRLSDQITFMNLTAFSCPGGLFIGSQTSRLSVLNCQALLKPGRLLTTGADAVHVQAARIGPWVEGCHFEGLSDDGCNFYSIPNHIRDQLDPYTLEMEGASRILPGDRLAFFQPQSGRILAEIAVDAVSGRTVTFSEVLPEFNNLAPEETPYDAKEWKIYDHAYNLDATGNYFVFRNNTIRDGRRYGSYFKASYGLISGNRFEGLSHAAITAWNEPGWPEGFYSHNLVIAENAVGDCASQDSAAVKISFKNLGAYSTEAGKQSNIYLYRNRIENPYGPALDISRTDGITFAANRISSGPSITRAVIMKDIRIRPDDASFAIADEFDRPDGIVTDPAEVPSLLGSDWLSAAGSQWQILNQELILSGAAHVANRTAATPNGGAGDWFIASTLLRLDTTDSGVWAGLAFNYDEGSGQFLTFRFNGEGRVQFIRPDGTAELNTIGFAHMKNRPYQLTAASFQSHAYYLEVKDTVTGEVLYSDTVANTQSSSNGLSNGVAGVFSGTGASVFQKFQVWNSSSEPVFTSVRGVPLSWYAAQGITPQSEGVSTWEELDELDSTGQGATNWQVYAGGTDPLDPDARFEITGLSRDDAGRLTLAWRGGTNGAGGAYTIQHSENLTPPDWRFIGLQKRKGGLHEWTVSTPVTNANGFFKIETKGVSF
jgi:hypothetical protein